jgi:hypothetical protein
MRSSANIKKGGKGRESIILCLDGQSALPDLLCDVLYLNDRIGIDNLQKDFVGEGYRTERRGASR